VKTSSSIDAALINNQYKFLISLMDFIFSVNRQLAIGFKYILTFAEETCASNILV